MKVPKNGRRIILALILAFLAWIIGGYYWAVQKERNLTWASFALQEGDHQLFFSLPKGTYIVYFSDDLSAELNIDAHEVDGLNSEVSVRNTFTGNSLIEYSSDHFISFTVSNSDHIRAHQIDIYLSFSNSDRQFVYLKMQRL